MTNGRRQAIILGVLLLVCGLVYLRPWRRQAPAPGADPSASLAAHVTGEVAKLDPVLLAKQRAAQRAAAGQMTWSRDPFSASNDSSSGGPLTLSGIMWDPAVPIAIINGTPVTVGERVAGVTITQIAEDRVVVSDGTSTSELRVAP